MTEHTETQDTETQDSENTNPDTTTDNNPETNTDNREAAKYRRRLRETETERDRLAQQLETLQKDNIEAAATNQLTKPSALWALGYQPADFLTDNHIDTEKVQTICQQAITDHGLGDRQAQLISGNVVPREGYNPPPPDDRTDFDNAFGPNW